MHSYHVHYHVLRRVGSLGGCIRGGKNQAIEGQIFPADWKLLQWDKDGPKWPMQFEMARNGQLIPVPKSIKSNLLSFIAFWSHW